MSFSEYDSAFVWSCEGCGLECEFERSQQPGYFMSCVSEIKATWPAPGSEDTELGVLMELEVGHGETEVYSRVQA